TLTLPDLALKMLPIETTTVNFDLALGIDQSETGLFCTFYYKTDLFDAATIARMAEHYQVLLAGIAADPDCRIAALPLLPPAEQHELLVTRNATQEAYPDTLCLHQFVEAQ